MSYSCAQEIIVLENADECDQVFADLILQSNVQFLGLDCEWNTERPVSLLQIATPTHALLVRLNKLNFLLPENVRLVLEDPTIYKVGVNIENDSEKLKEDCFCEIKSWVDLRHVAARCSAWGPCLVEQVESHEFQLKFFNQDDPNSDTAKQANGRRLSWCPKMGLESLVMECVKETLPKNTSARWSDDWEAPTLQPKQLTYAANDATASLDIFAALVSASVEEQSLPVSISFDIVETISKHTQALYSAVKDLLDKPFLQTKEDMLRIYELIETTNPELDITRYYTKPPKSKKKSETKEYYKKKAKEAKAKKSQNSFLVATLEQSFEQSIESTFEQPTQYPESSGSHSFDEITRALAHTKPDLTAMTEKFLSLQDEPCFSVLFHFKHNTVRTSPLIPGYSYGRGSVAPNGYRLFRNRDSETQTEWEFIMGQYKRVYPSYKPVTIDDFESENSVNTDHSFIFRPPPVNQPPTVRCDSPAAKSCISDSISECSSSNYQSSVGKGSVVSRGRGRGRGVKVTTVDSDTDSRKGRGRGRGNAGTRPPKPCDEEHVDKFEFRSKDIRYQDPEEDLNRPHDLEIENRPREHPTALNKAPLTREPMSDRTPTAAKTPTNSFAGLMQSNRGQNNSSYSNYSIQDIMSSAEPRNTRPPAQYIPRNAYSSRTVPTRPPLQARETTGQYEYKSDVFRQAVQRNGESLHISELAGDKPPPPTVQFDWNKFREEQGIEVKDGGNVGAKVNVSLDWSDSDSMGS